MFSNIKRLWKKKKFGSNKTIDPDEIFLDSKNLPDFDKYQLEGRLEKPISYNVFNFLGFFVLFIGIIFTYRLWDLQIAQGEEFRKRSDNNNLHNTLIFADRGIIYDRNKKPIVWNTTNPDSVDFSLRQYSTSTGLSTTVGYIKYPTKDSSGFYFQEKFVPQDGIEKIYNEILSGRDGIRIVETDVRGNIVSQSVVQSPQDGGNLDLSIDLDLQKRLYDSIIDISERGGFKGGAGVIMDVNNGEILALANFPEYESQVISLGKDTDKINSWLKNNNHPFLNRVINGLYTPGSIMKVFVAMGVLDENIIDPRKQILSTGSITIPNPFFPDKPSVFMDWRAHGLVDLRRAIAVSSNIYFYAVSGGFGGQKGIGIEKMEKYVRSFGFGNTTGINFYGEKIGTIPNPEWKKNTFNGDAWRVGDTYNTSIGQYGFQVSPIQVVRALGGLVTEGKLVTPTLLKTNNTEVLHDIVSYEFDKNDYTIVKEGMRMCVTEGTCGALNFSSVDVAGKTGTAQIGVSKNEVNSWIMGFWPYKNPKYAFVVVMERGSRGNQFGAVLVMNEFFKWVEIYKPEYLN